MGKKTMEQERKEFHKQQKENTKMKKLNWTVIITVIITLVAVAALVGAFIGGIQYQKSVNADVQSQVKSLASVVSKTNQQ